jgi:hypothetical protein
LDFLDFWIFFGFWVSHPNPIQKPNFFWVRTSDYDKLSYTSSEDSPSMDIVALFGNVGGTLGLFLGLSVLSFCEVLHVIFESCIHFNHRITKK